MALSTRDKRGQNYLINRSDPFVRLTAPHNPWATTFSPNVHSHYHLIHTAHTQRDPYNTYPFWPYLHPIEDDWFPTVTTFAPTVAYTRLANVPPRPWGPINTLSFHHEVGFDPATLPMMINAARAAGVPVRLAPLLRAYV